MLIILIDRIYHKLLFKKTRVSDPAGYELGWILQTFMFDWIVSRKSTTNLLRFSDWQAMKNKLLFFFQFYDVQWPFSIMSYLASVYNNHRIQERSLHKTR